MGGRGGGEECRLIGLQKTASAAKSVEINLRSWNNTYEYMFSIPEEDNWFILHSYILLPPLSSSFLSFPSSSLLFAALFFCVSFIEIAVMIFFLFLYIDIVCIFFLELNGRSEWPLVRSTRIQQNGGWLVGWLIGGV